jgi:hypothetical protein
VRVDWSRPAFETRRRQFSVAAFAAFDPAVAASAVYRSNLAYLRPGLVRMHNAALLYDSRREGCGWWDAAAGRWDADKIRRALGAWAPDDAERMICVPGWPDHMDADRDGRLDASRPEDFAALCADLARIAAPLGVRWWEITNEKDAAYWIEPAKRGEPSHAAELGRVFARCAAAIKAAVPGLRTGGPSAMRPDRVGDLRAFVRAAGPDLEFFSFHTYFSGNAADADADVYRRARSVEGYLRGLRELLGAECPGRRVELHLNEYNISWTWRNRDPRMTNHKGAVVDALVLIGLARGGADAGNAWNERDGVYGKMDAAGTLRPAAHVFHLFNGALAGRAVETSADAGAALAVLAVQGEAGRAVALVRPSDRPAEVALEMADAGAGPVAWRRYDVDADGFRA